MVFQMLLVRRIVYQALVIQIVKWVVTGFEFVFMLHINKINGCGDGARET